MDQALLERDHTLAALIGAVEDAAAGRGSVALVSGGAGIGKTSVVRAFAREAAGRARVLLSACDDLMAPRTLGPLRDAALESGGTLGAAFAEGRPVDGVFTAVLAELAAAPPTALVVEDVHWADDATIDVLGYVARRIEAVPAVVVLTFRDDEVGPSHPLQRLLGALAGRPVRRLALPPLSRAAVRQLAASTGADADAGAVHRVTGGNPFFVTEVLASPADVVPATVVEAVLARVRRLDPACREALEQLSVVPSRIRFDLAGELLGERIDTLAAAELAGVLEVSAHHLGFRHELARRAIERSLPALARRRLNERVLRALQLGERPDRASLMHFAVEAGDVETVLAVGPGQRAKRPGPGRTGRRSRISNRSVPTCSGSTSASARPCSTTTAGSSTTPIASGMRWMPDERRPRCTSGWVTRSRSRIVSCASRATCSWPARRSRRSSARTGR
jgi:hypothetical protein